MRNYLLFIGFLLYNLTIAQEKVSDITLNIDSKSMFFEIVDAKSKELLLYQRDGKVSKVLKTNDKFEIIDSLFLETPQTTIFKQFSGHYKTNGYYSTYWSNNKHDSIFYQHIDFNTRELKNKTIAVDLNKEIFLKSIAVGSSFYLISIPKKGNSLTFHRFREGEYDKRIIDFKGETFFYSDNKYSQSIWDIFKDGFLGAQTISNIIPTALPLTEDKKKLYVRNDKELLFTFDGSALYTQILKINTDDLSFAVTTCEKSILEPVEGLEENSNTNSFICNDKLFQLISNSNNIIVDVKNLNFETLKSYKINYDQEQEIEFINSKIIEENISISNTKILDKSHQLIRKLNFLNIGITSYFKDNKYYVTIGGFSNIINPNNAMMYGAMFGIAGALLAVALAPSYSIQNINSYANRKVVYVHSLFDENLNHLNENLNTLPFDSLRQFIEFKNNLKNQMVFKFDKTTYFAGYDKKTKLMSFYKFND